MNQPLKKYTAEDNIRYIAFGIKDLVKQMEQMNRLLMQLLTKDEKLQDENDLPF